MLWPPSWQDGNPVSLEDIDTVHVFSDPMVKDPRSGKSISSIKAWLTDQVYLGGHGDEYLGVGTVTNEECKKKYKGRCGKRKTPWASPGVAPSLGGGCGVHGGNPFGCRAHKDKRPPGSNCVDRATYAFGSSALDVEFPQATTTEWMLGSSQEVGWVSRGGHKGGYTYRLCKMPAEGKKGLTEECFARNVLEFATNTTMVRRLEVPGNWEEVEQSDLTSGTFPEGSAWRHVAKTMSGKTGGYLFKDEVTVPRNLPVGDYVLSFRWDTVDPQIWVSCANVKLTLPA